MEVQDMLTKLSDAVNELTTLQIVTRVGDLEITVDEKGNASFTAAGNPVASAVTRLSMTGDIFTSRTPTVVTGEYALVGEYHERMVEKSQAIIQANVSFLIGVIKELKAL